MNVLVIGGNGFIGSHLVDYLLEEKHYVRVFDQTPERYRPLQKNVDYRLFSINNISELYEALYDIDVIFYLASASVPSTSDIDIAKDVNQNLITTIKALDTIVSHNIKRIIYFSSGGAVYGRPISTPTNELHSLEPISSYGIIKLSIEKYLFLYQEKYKIKPLIIRPSNPFGPRQGHYLAQGVITTFLRKLKDGGDIQVFGKGDMQKDYIYIKDLIEGCTRLAFSGAVGAYNYGMGEGHSLNQIINSIEIVTGEKLNVQYVSKKTYDVENFVLDMEKTISVLGRLPRTELIDGIRMTWDWINKGS